MAEIIDLPAFRARQAAARAEGRHLGLGVATFIEAAPGPREGGGGGGMMGPEQMRMRLEADGTVSVFTSQMPHGQGHETTFAQIAADEVGVPFEQVRVVAGDSDSAPIGLRHRRQPRRDDGRRSDAAHRAWRFEIASSRRRPICSRRVPATSSSSRARSPCGGCPVSAITLADVAGGRDARAARSDPCASTAARAAGRAAPTARSSRSTSRPVR